MPFPFSIVEAVLIGFLCLLAGRIFVGRIALKFCREFLRLDLAYKRIFDLKIDGVLASTSYLNTREFFRNVCLWVLIRMDEKFKIFDLEVIVARVMSENSQRAAASSRSG